jgi:glycosyltransferase involved in cell wall biosynthesis
MMQTNNPKIMHVILSMQVGGAERLVSDMVRYPAFAANKPIVCCLDTIGELGEKLLQDGYTVYCKGRQPGLDVTVIGWLREIMKREHVEVVHAHQYSPLFYTVPAAFLSGRKKLVYTEHGRFHPERKSWKRMIFNPLLSLGVDHLVAISAATAQAMARYDNFPLSRIKVIHNGIDCSTMNRESNNSSKRQELGLDSSCRILGTAGRLNSIKNMSMMIRGLKLVLHQVPDTYLVIAGQGEEREMLQRLADQLDVGDRVKFIGLRFDLPEIYPLFDVFLLTSFTEGISVTLLEAMASGVPAVVSDVGGNREIVLDGKSGYLVPVDDDLLLAQKVVTLLKDGKLGAQMGKVAKQRVQDQFSVDGMIRRYRKLYN